MMFWVSRRRKPVAGESTVKMEAAGYLESLQTTHSTTEANNPEDHVLMFHRCGNL